MDQRQFAKTLRQGMTDAEQQLWRQLRAHRLYGQKFRRQQPLGPYVVDFIHFGARLIVEADGGQHDGRDKDAVRDRWLKQQGFKIMRFWNNDILRNPEGVWRPSWRRWSRRLPLSPNPSPARGEGSD